MNVHRACVGSFDGMLHKDIGGVNIRLAEECRKHEEGMLIPFGCVNPNLPDWREDMRRCHEDYKMPGIRLHPNYHGYTLDEPVYAELAAMAAQRGLIVQLAVKMEDERTQHPLLSVDPVVISPLRNLLAKQRKLRLVLLNSLRTLLPDQTAWLAQTENVYFEIAMQERIGGVTRLLKDAP